MRVIIAVFTYYPDVNGVQYVTQYQAEGLAALGHSVKVLTSNHSNGMPSHDKHNGVEIERIDMWSNNMIHHGDRKGYQRLLLEEASKSDVIMLVYPESWSTDCALSVVGKLPCAKVLMVHGIHDFRSARAKDRSAYAKMKKAVADARWWPYYRTNWSTFKKFEAVIQLDRNDFGYRYFLDHGIESHVLCNAIDDRMFERSDKQKRIINVGTYHRNKNQITCLEAFYRAELPQWELMLVGPKENAYYERLLARREQLEGEFGQRDVRIIVGESRDDTIRHIRESQIYLLTSVTEMQPVSLLEAMATGAAFVSTDVGVVRFLPGGLVRETPEEMANALFYLAQNNRWATYGALGREYALENCRMGTQINRLEGILKEAMVRHASA